MYGFLGWPFSPYMSHILSKSVWRLSNNASGLGCRLWPSWPCYDSTAGTTELKSAEYQSGWMSVFSSVLMLQLKWCWGINTVSSHAVEECVVQQKSAVVDAVGANGGRAVIQSGETGSREVIFTQRLQWTNTSFIQIITKRYFSIYTLFYTAR